MALSLLIYLDHSRFNNSNEASNDDEEEPKFDSNKVVEYARGDISEEEFIKLLTRLEERRKINRSTVGEF